MGFQPLQDGVRAVIQWGNVAEQWTNTLYLTRANFTLAEQQILADLIQDEWENIADLFLEQSFSLLSVAVYDIRTIIGPVVYDQRPAYPGIKTGGAGSIANGLVVTMRTAQRGRSGRGRHYLAGFSEAVMSASIVDDPLMVTNIGSSYTAAISTFTTNGWTWVIASGQQNGVVLPELVPYPITSCEVRNSSYGTQRRRINRA